MKRKKKLPRYWLGTRMPTDLGHQPNYGIGGQQMSSTPGQSLYPEIQTTKANTIPSALNKLQTTSSFAIDALKGIAPASLGTSIARAGAHRAGQAVIQIAPDVLPAAGGHASNIANVAAEQGAQEGAKIAGKTTLGTLGTITAGIGTAYGLADMGMQIAANKDHRSAGQMRDTLTTNTYTTDLGNQYTTHGGVNLSNELDYARAQRRSRNLNFTASAIGTGASAGALIGSLAASGAAAGSIAPGIGTAIGAGVGLLGGGIAYLAGLGKTEEETKQAASDLADSISMEDKMSKSIALSQDAKQGFYGRTKSGSLGANCGKRPIHARNGKGNAMVSHGEVIGNLSEGWAYREPGVPDNNDTLKRHLKADDFVISNKFGLSDYAATTGDYLGALQAQDILMKQMKYNAKNGKLPKCGNGWWDRAFLAVPNLMQSLAAVQQYNKDKSMPAEAPAITPDYSSARNQAFQILGDLIPSRAYEKMIDDEVSRNKYAIRRMPGMGMGGRAVLMDSADKTGLNEKMKQMLAIDEHNMARRDAARKLLATTDTHAEDMNVQAKTDRAHRYAQASAAKYNNEAQDLKNIVLPFGQLVGDWWKYDQFQDSKDWKQKMLNLYDSQVKLDWEKFLNSAKDDKPTASNYSAYVPMMKTPTFQTSLSNFKPKGSVFNLGDYSLSVPQTYVPYSMRYRMFNRPTLTFNPTYSLQD